MADITAIGQDDSLDHRSDIEEEPESAPVRRSTRRSRRNANAAPKPLEHYDINLDHYVKYIRHISIEAEHNRFNEDAKMRATNAINVFGTNYVWDPPGPHMRTRLRSLEIRIVPLWEDSIGNEGGFTFLDWFTPQSSMVEAIRNLSCDEVNIKLLPCNRNRARRSRRVQDATAAEMEDEGSYRTRNINMHAYQVDKLLADGTFADPWGECKVMQSTRQARIQGMERSFETLFANLEVDCRDPNYGERGYPGAKNEDAEEAAPAEDDQEGGDMEDEVVEEQDDEDDEDYEDS